MTKMIALRNGGITLVDDADAEWLTRYSWAGYTMRSGLRYATTSDLGERVYMHRLIVGAAPGMEVDHRNGDGLDNQRVNLREVTHAQNLQNRHRGYGRTGERNVTVLPSGRFFVKLEIEGKPLCFGTYDTLAEAVHVARQARLEHFPFSVETETPEYVGPSEEWRPSRLAPGYQVARDGRIRKIGKRPLKPQTTSRLGTQHIEARVAGKRLILQVSKLVADAWRIDV